MHDHNECSNCGKVQTLKELMDNDLKCIQCGTGINSKWVLF